MFVQNFLSVLEWISGCNIMFWSDPCPLPWESRCSGTLYWLCFPSQRKVDKSLMMQEYWRLFEATTYELIINMWIIRTQTSDHLLVNTHRKVETDIIRKQHQLKYSLLTLKKRHSSPLPGLFPLRRKWFVVHMYQDIVTFAKPYINF